METMFLVLCRGTADMKNVLKFTYSLIYHQQILVGIANTTPFQILLDIFLKVSLKLLKKRKPLTLFLTCTYSTVSQLANALCAFLGKVF